MFNVLPLSHLTPIWCHSAGPSSERYTIVPFNPAGMPSSTGIVFESGFVMGASNLMRSPIFNRCAFQKKEKPGGPFTVRPYNPRLAAALLGTPPRRQHATRFPQRYPMVRSTRLNNVVTDTQAVTGYRTSGSCVNICPSFPANLFEAPSSTTLLFKTRLLIQQSYPLKDKTRTQCRGVNSLHYPMKDSSGLWRRRESNPRPEISPERTSTCVGSCCLHSCQS